LLAAWREFLRGKRKRNDVAEFSLHLSDHIMALHDELANKTYHHGPYHAFKIRDPKPRDIHKASVRDRLVHHALHRILYPFFDRTFIFDSYSCRCNKGVHRAINRFRDFGRKVSCNHTRTAWVLKCDIRRFFANIDHDILKHILQQHCTDKDVIWLVQEIIDSFHTPGKTGVGLPLGNLTSQLLVNIYMNEFDQYIKRTLKVAQYIRYSDDFVLLHENRHYLVDCIPNISEFLQTQLGLSLHPHKLTITTLASGVDFLGWVHFPHYRVLRTTTKRRMLKRIAETQSKESLASYIGLLSHGSTYKLTQSPFFSMLSDYD
jgi:RNA-directed DNA polymerase